MVLHQENPVTHNSQKFWILLGDNLIPLVRYLDVIYLDMSKTFDRVRHHVLIGTIQQYGLPTDVMQWVQSYLTNCRQRITVLSQTSDSKQVTSVVPQGFVLGNILFLLYVIILYQIMYPHRNWHHLQMTLRFFNRYLI